MFHGFKAWLFTSLLVAAFAVLPAQAKTLSFPLEMPEPPAVATASAAEMEGGFLFLAPDGQLYLAAAVGKNPHTGQNVYVLSPSGLFGEGFTGFVASKIAGFANERMNRAESEFARNFWASVAQGYEQNAANDKVYQACIKGQRLAEAMTKGDGTADQVALQIIGEQAQESLHEAAEMTPVPDFIRMCDEKESGFARFVYGWSGAGKTILLLLPLKGGGVKTSGGAEATVRTPAVVRPPPLPKPVPAVVMPGEAGVAARTVEAGGNLGESLKNPHANAHGFSARNVNKVDGTRNCANTSIAMDATLAGRPASALDAGVTSTIDLELHFGGTFSRGLTSESIVSQLSKTGPGSRGIVFGYRGPGKVGHFFNVANQGGTVRFVDAQTGTGASLQGFREFWLLPTH